MKRIAVIVLFLFLIKPSFAQAATAGTLTDFWNDKAVFYNEEKLTFPGTPYDAQYDFYYNTHDMGMGVIEDPNHPGWIYYVAAQWKGTPTVLEPHIYKSTDGGKTFNHLTKLFDVTDSGTCTTNSTYAYWNYNSKIWCLFQMREPDVTYFNGNYYLVFEGAAKSGAEQLLGPVVVRLSSLDITVPVTVSHGNNFRQNPLFRGDLTISGSTPFWQIQSNQIYVFWAGMYPVTSPTRERVDTYRGHFSSTPGGATPDCADPILCYFTVDEGDISKPNMAKGAAGSWDSSNANGLSLFRENTDYFMFYIGSTGADCAVNKANRWGMSMAKSPDLKTWTKKYGTVSGPAIKWASLYNTLGNLSDGCSYYGKLVKLSGIYYLYYYEVRSPNLNGQPIARTYRQVLLRAGSDLNNDTKINSLDLLLLKSLNLFTKVNVGYWGFNY